MLVRSDRDVHYIAFLVDSPMRDGKKCHNLL